MLALINQPIEGSQSNNIDFALVGLKYKSNVVLNVIYASYLYMYARQQYCSFGIVKDNV
jgi:hypothetical protein